ncbi:MAG: saccharopine dehydrogenase C-terminal domain-containing protein [Candidatus Krumholzibacteriia bacterium]
MKYLLLGAGLQGTAIAFDLLHQTDGTSKLVVVDADQTALDALSGKVADPRLLTVLGDVRDDSLLAEHAREADVMVSAVNYWFNEHLTQLALQHRCHFLDLGGNNEVVSRQFELDETARERGVTVIPDCGLAPGVAGILACHLQRPFTSVEHLRIRVGGLPLRPQPPLDYQLVFAVQGLINEYVEPAVVIRDGRIAQVPSLTELETLRFPAPFGELEAFQTSGGTSTLPDTLLGRVHNLDYKTIRYSGHGERMRLLMDLGLMGDEPVVMPDGAAVKPRDLLGHLLERHLPREGDDVVLMLVEVEGMAPTVGDVAPAPCRRSLRVIDHADQDTGISAMMRMTGYPAAIIARMLASGVITDRGVCRQEVVVPAERMLEELAARGVRIEQWDSHPAAPPDV